MQVLLSHMFLSYMVRTFPLNCSIEAGESFLDVETLNSEKQEKNLGGNNLHAQRPTLVGQTQGQVDLAYSADPTRILRLL